MILGNSFFSWKEVVIKDVTTTSAQADKKEEGKKSEDHLHRLGSYLMGLNQGFI